VKPVVFHDRAKAELEEAAAWYERRRSGLGGEFRIAVEHSIQRIRENPQVGSSYATTRFRHVFLRRFPYVVFYREDANAIWVVAIAHGRRRPDYWKNRGID
jgi:toxin ParE1/3/4